MKHRSTLFKVIHTLASRGPEDRADLFLKVARPDLDGESDQSEESALPFVRAQWFDERALGVPDAGFFRYLESFRQAESLDVSPTITVTRLAEELIEPDSDIAMVTRVVLKQVLPGPSPPHPLGASSPFGYELGPQFLLSDQEVPSLLALDLAVADLSDLDLETAAFYGPLGTPFAGIIEASQFFNTDKLLLGLVRRSGYYQAIVLPKNPWDPPLAAGEASKLTKEQEVECRKPPALALQQFAQLFSNPWKFVGPAAASGSFDGIGRVTQIGVHPNDGAIVVAAAAGGGVWRTDDSGRSWRPTMSSQPALAMGAVAFAPSRPDLIYAASGEDAGPASVAMPGGILYRSSDGGEHWSVMASVSSTRFSAIVVDPRDHLTLYVAGNLGLHKSRDGGRTWIVNPGLLCLFDGQVTDVVIAPDAPDMVFIGVYNRGLFKSETGGECRNSGPAFQMLDVDKNLRGLPGWPKLAIGRGKHPDSTPVAVRFDSVSDLSSDTTPIVHVYISRDGGKSWKEDASAGVAATTTQPEWEGFIALQPQHSNTLIVGADCSVNSVKLGTGGALPGLAPNSRLRLHEDQQDIAFDPANPDRFYVANDGGVYLFPKKDADSWEFAAGDLNITQVYDLDTSEKDPEVIVCGTQDNGFFFRNRGDGPWEQRGHTDVGQVAIDPADPSIFYFANCQALPEQRPGSCNLVRLTGSGAQQYSLDCGDITGGSPFVTIMRLQPDGTIADPGTKRELFVCGFFRLFYSTNSGNSFHVVADGPSTDQEFIPEGEISALEYSSNQYSILYLATLGGRVYRATSGGRRRADWERLERRLGNSPVTALCADPLNPMSVWVGLSAPGVLRKSTVIDGVANPFGVSHLFRLGSDGKTWQDVSGKTVKASLPDVPISSIVIDDQAPDTVYVATNLGVFRTSDGGHSWHSFQDGLPRTPVTRLRLNRRTRRLFAGTMGRGIFSRPI